MQIGFSENKQIGLLRKANHFYNVSTLVNSEKE